MRVHRKRYKTGYTALATVVVAIILAVFGFHNYSPSKSTVTEDVANKVSSSVQYTPFQFTGNRQVTLDELDNLGRARGAHIQLKDSDEPPSGSRSGSLKNCTPIGFKQQKVQGSYLWDRGHLIGYQFSGIMCDEPELDIRNFVPETHWFNAGDAKKFNDKNSLSMVYYEDKLDKWLSQNKSSYLDYQVNPYYEGNELVPRYIVINYTGFDSTGHPIPVDIHVKSKTNGNINTVILENGAQKGVTINYMTGVATEDLKNKNEI